jgi:hypothetical protein
MNLLKRNSVIIAGQELLNLPNLLLISGSGRNVGKTTLGCKIVSEVASHCEITAIKVSSHFHPLLPEQKILIEDVDLIIVRETDSLSGKDSSRYLRAGASKVYYIQSTEAGLKRLSLWISENIPEEVPVVCESGGLGNLIYPGYAVFIDNGIGKRKPNYHFDLEVISEIERGLLKTEIKWKAIKWEK